MFLQAAEWSAGRKHTTHPTPRSLVSGWQALLSAAAGDSALEIGPIFQDNGTSF